MNLFDITAYIVLVPSGAFVARLNDATPSRTQLDPRVTLRISTQTQTQTTSTGSIA